MDLATVKQWLANPLVRTLLLLIGGQFVKRWGVMAKKLVPLVLLALSIVIEGITAMFPDAAKPTLHAAPPAALWHFAVAVLLPVLLAVGIQSSIKNTAQGVLLIKSTRATPQK